MHETSFSFLYTHLAVFISSPRRFLASPLSRSTHRHLYAAHQPLSRYPDNNCAAVFQNPDNPIKDPQTLLGNYYRHSVHATLLNGYLGSTLLVQQKGQKFIMFETNTYVLPRFQQYRKVDWSFIYFFLPPVFLSLLPLSFCPPTLPSPFTDYHLVPPAVAS